MPELALPPNPATLALLTMDPAAPHASIALTSCFMHRYTPRTLMPNIQSKSFVEDVISPLPATPACVDKTFG
jgi:hypothetical protein